MVVSIQPRRSGMAKGQRAILHSIRRPLRPNVRSHFRPRQPDSLEDAQRRDQLRFLLKRISKADRKIEGRKAAYLSVALRAVCNRVYGTPGASCLLGLIS